LHEGDLQWQLCQIGLSLGSIEVRDTIWELEDVRFEKRFVCGAGLVMMAGPLRMEFEGLLESFERLFDLELPGVIELLGDAVIGLDIERCEGGLLQISESKWLFEDVVMSC
jgi:hypothetical protein